MAAEHPRPARPRLVREWTPALIRSAETSAESGNLGSAASICEWLLGDDAVGGALDARCDALLGLPVTFRPGPVPSAAASVAVENDWDECYPEAELRTILTWGALLGVAPFRNEVETDDETGRWLTRIRFWDPQSLQQDQITGEWTILDVDRNKYVIDDGDGVFGLHLPLGESRPWSRALWRRVARWVLLKQYAQRDWARHGEIAARMFVTMPLDKDGNVPNGTSDAQRKQIVEEIQAAGGEMAAALPPGYSVSLLELTANTEQIYKAQIAAADSAIRILIRGGDLSSDAGGGGSYAAAESQAQTSEHPKRRFDAAALSTTLRKKSLAYWAEYNYGVKGVAPWPQWEPPRSDEAVNYNSFALALASLSGLGAEFDLNILQTRFGLDFITKIDPANARQAQAGFFGQADAPTPGAVAPIAAGNVAPVENPSPTPAGTDPDAAQFAEALAAEAAAEAERSTVSIVDKLQAAVNASTSPADLERRLKAAFGEVSLEELATLSEKAAILAELSGRYAAISEL